MIENFGSAKTSNCEGNIWIVLETKIFACCLPLSRTTKSGPMCLAYVYVSRAPQVILMCISG